MPEPDVQPEVNEGLPPEIAPVSEAVDTVNSASEDAVLDRLLGFDEPEESTPVVSTPDVAPQADADFDRAIKALQRDGVPADVIDSLKSNPSKVKEWGLKAAKRQADVDSYGNKIAESKKSAADAQVETEISASTDDGEADADPLSSFGEIFGDEAAKPLRNLAERLRSEFDERSRVLETKYESQMAYSRIAGEYGRSAPSYDDITEIAARIGRERPGAFPSIDALVREAFNQKVGQPKKIDPRNIARPTVGKTAARAIATKDREDMVLDVLLSGGSKEDARRITSR